MTFTRQKRAESAIGGSDRDATKAIVAARPRRKRQPSLSLYDLLGGYANVIKRKTLFSNKNPWAAAFRGLSGRAALRYEKRKC